MGCSDAIVPTISMVIALGRHVVDIESIGICFWVISVVSRAAVSRHGRTRVILSSFVVYTAKCIYPDVIVTLSIKR